MIKSVVDSDFASSQSAPAISAPSSAVVSKPLDSAALPTVTAADPATVDPLAPEVKPALQFNLQGFGREFFTAFFTIFLAELGDKTQLSTLLMTAESHSPWVVFVGAAAALLMTSLLGVIIGRWIAQHLPPSTLKTATGVSLLLISALLFWDMAHL